MNIIELLKEEFTLERDITGPFFANYPPGKGDYKPHEKSMSMQVLSAHIAEIFGWPEMIINTSELNFAVTPYQTPLANNSEDLIRLMNEGYKHTMQTLSSISENVLEGKWSLKNGDYIIQEWSKYAAIRHSLDQIKHHRAQLGVYFRLNNIPVPPSYGPSADTE